tara:strand:+ start:71 stop:526 length:456 start_codon:yes stop_codon:yes gene_type:complete
MAEKKYLLALKELSKKNNIKIKEKERKLAKEIVKRWDKTWTFVGRKTELKKTEKGVFFYLSMNYEGDWFKVASLAFRIDRKSHFFIQAPNPDRRLWKNQRLANTLDFLANEWFALEFSSGRGKRSVVIPLNQIQTKEDIDFMVEDLLEVTQ